jgi:N-acetylmuramoyl-L-alanine amidase
MVSGKLRRRDLLRIAGLLAAAMAGDAAFRGAADAAELGRAKPRPPMPLPRHHTIVIDPGHGGVDPGTIGVSGVYEKDVTLSVARDVARQLDATRRYHVVMTRTTDDFIALRDRVARARAANGDLFLSLHADALPNAAMRGASVFTLSEQASDREAAALAARENKADLIAGIDLSRHTPEVSSILLDLARRQTNNLSIGLARQLVAELGSTVPLLANSHRAAGFAVLKAPDIPSALVEMGCLSNREEDKLLRNPLYQRKLAGTLVRSVNDFFDTVLKA